MSPAPRRKIELRSEKTGANRYNLRAYLEPDGSLVLEGQDLGPIAAAGGADDGEYEYFKTVRAEHIPQLRELLGIPADDDLLDALHEHWSGERSWTLEERLRESGLPIETRVW